MASLWPSLRIGTLSLALFLLANVSHMDKSKFKRQGNILCPLVGETPKIHGKGHGYGEMWRIGTNDVVYQCWEWFGHKLIRFLLGAPLDQCSGTNVCALETDG